MSDELIPHIKQKSTSFASEYQWAVDAGDEQWRDFWLAKDYHMKDDNQDFRTNLTKPERQAWIHANIIINHYEGYLGNDVWGGRFKEIFPRYEFQRTASIFSAIEDGVHATLYNQMMDYLGLNTDEFHDKVFYNPEMKVMLDLIKNSLVSDDDLTFLATVCFLEGLSIYQILTFMMSFRKPRGLGYMKNAVSGVIHSTRDELIHFRFSGRCFQELKSQFNLSEEEELRLKNKIKSIGEAFLYHELELNNQLFSFGDLRNTTKESMSHFAKHRLNECFDKLGYPDLTNKLPELGEGQEDIRDWFYLLSQSQTVNDFFQVTGTEYEMAVNKDLFVW